MAYAILRFAKRKGGAAKAIAAHNERTKEAYASNPDIDKSRTVQNYHLIAPRWSYGQEIRHRISMAGCRAEGQREIRGHAGYGKSGVRTGTHGGDAGVFHAGFQLSERARGRGEYLFRRGAHGREDAAPAPLLCPADEGQAVVRKRDPWQQEGDDPMAGRFLCLYVGTVAGAGARHTCRRNEA